MQATVGSAYSPRRTENSRLGITSQGQDLLGLILNFRVFVIDVAPHCPSIHSFWSKENSIARFMAIWLSIMLCMSTRCQCLSTTLTAKARPVPILSQGCHLLRKIDPLITSRAHVGLSGEGRDTGSFAGPSRGTTNFPILCSN